MPSDTTKAAAVLFVLGGGLLVAAPWWPQAVSPLPREFQAAEPAAAPLREAISRFERTCARGDVDALDACVTKARRVELERVAATLDRELDADLLRQGAGDSLGDARSGDGFAGFADGDRACLVGPARDARGGIVAIVFARDDDAYLLDEVVHKPGVDATDGDAVRAFGQAALRGLRAR